MHITVKDKGSVLDKNQRIKHIINTLQVKNAISIKTLMKEFDVSEMTVRRDLTLLADDGIVELIPGGAILKTDTERDEERYLITHEETRRTREKIKIGKKAASMIEPNDTIILDVGSTTEYIAKFIPEEIPVTILCYALNILVEIYRKKNCNPIFAGGYFHDNTLMFESQDGINLIKKIRADKAFISAAGVSDELGVTCANPYEIDTKKTVLKSAKTKILITDSTKFGKVKIAYFAELQEFNMVITDSEIPEEYIKIIRNIGLDLYMA
jgi:DeoR family deoxyribose operon repressor